MIVKTLFLVRNALLFIAALFFLWLAGYLTFAAWVANMKPEASSTPTDAIVVLTGGARRVNTALDLLADGSAQQLFISGVNDAVSLRDLMELWQSDEKDKESAACCIILDHKSRNTAQNAVEAGEWTKGRDVKTIRLVTSAYHMPRAWLEFRRARPDLEIHPHPVVSLETDLASGVFWRITFEEYHKTLVTLISTKLWPELHVGDLKGVTPVASPETAETP